MASVELFLLCIAAVFLIGVIGELVFARTGVPDVVWLIVVGIFMGPVFGFVDRGLLLDTAPFFGALTLVIVLFDGGVSLRLGELVSAAPRSLLLAVLGFIGAVGSMAVVSMMFAKMGLLPKDSWTWMHGLILGTIVGGASSVVIMPALDLAGLDDRLSNLLKLESALTDVLCVVGAVTLIELAVGGAFDKGAVLSTLASSFGIGIFYGVFGGLMWILLHRLWGGSRHEYPITLSGLLILYVLTARAGGSAALAILSTAVVIGNAGAVTRMLKMRDAVSLDLGVERFHGVVSFMIKSFFFCFIGLMLQPPWSLIAVGAVLGLVLLAVRWPAAQLALRGAGFSRSERSLVVVSMPRGMAAGVLAILPAQAGIPGMTQLPVVVFSCVVVTILAFSVGMPIMTKRLAAGEVIEQDAGDENGEAVKPAIRIMATEQAPRESSGEEHPTLPLT
jgi:cell volume regulation protein A